MHIRQVLSHTIVYLSSVEVMEKYTTGRKIIFSPFVVGLELQTPRHFLKLLTRFTRHLADAYSQMRKAY